MTDGGTIATVLRRGRVEFEAGGHRRWVFGYVVQRDDGIDGVARLGGAMTLEGSGEG